MRGCPIPVRLGCNAVLEQGAIEHRVWAKTYQCRLPLHDPIAEGIHPGWKPVEDAQLRLQVGIHLAHSEVVGCDSWKSECRCETRVYDDYGTWAGDRHDRTGAGRASGHEVDSKKNVEHR
jgi:hypothetical protein